MPEMKSVRPSNYLETLKSRGAKNRVSQSFQLVGLEIATILKDMPHKALYIKFAKEYNPGQLLALAKDVAERREVKNRGAYFMRVVHELKSGNK
jgi:TnpA family transposase